MPAISTAPETYPNDPVASAQGPWRDPRVLEIAWVSPRLLGQDELLARLQTSVLSGLTPGRHVAVSITGPKGSGTSSVAQWLVETTRAQLSRAGTKGMPLLLRVDVSTCRTPSALATALFRQIDSSFDGRGASTEFQVLLLLRRIRTTGRPAILLFDQVGAKVDLSRVLRPLAQPERLMPEGSAGLPPMLIDTAGARDPFPEDVDATRLVLPPVRGQLLHQAIIQRANLAFDGPASRGDPSWTGLPQEPNPLVGLPGSGSFGQAPPSPGAITMDAVRAIADISTAQGWGLSMVGELLQEAGRRAGARDGRWVEAEDVALPASLPRHGRDAEGFDALVIDALRATPGPVPVGRLRRLVAAACSERGARAPTQARLWRHLVALERRGVVSRDVRLGGLGGSATRVALENPGGDPSPRGPSDHIGEGPWPGPGARF